jgi:hypothetical protein
MSDEDDPIFSAIEDAMKEVGVDSPSKGPALKPSRPSKPAAARPKSTSVPPGGTPLFRQDDKPAEPRPAFDLKRRSAPPTTVPASSGKAVAYPLPPAKKRRPYGLIFAILVALVAAAGAGAWWFLNHPQG